MQIENNKIWQPGSAPIAVLMISLNEGHNMESVLKNLQGWAQEVFLVDSCSTDETIDIALRYGVHVVQRPFKGFGDQWNFALRELPITAPWVMKLDPDERISVELKESLVQLITHGDMNGIALQRRLWFMGRRLPIHQKILRVWRRGRCKFSDVTVNEHPLVSGKVRECSGYLEHHDSPHLDHWVIKQNGYTTAEAISQYFNKELAAQPTIFGTALERRMWLKRNFWRVPGRYYLLFFYHFVILGAWRAGKVGWIWSHLRTEVYRQWEYKKYEIALTGRIPKRISSVSGKPDSRVSFYE